MIEFDDVSFSYGPEAAPAVASVSLQVEPGEMVVVLGANGSGKSTLVRLSNGLLLPSSGHVRVDGIDTGDGPHQYELRASVGMVFQRPDDQIVATAVEDDVAFGPENLGLPRDKIRRRVDQALAAVGLTGMERREPHLLSGGQKQRLAIAGALSMRPLYLVLDEPTSMIDASGATEVRSVLRDVRAAGVGILLITHDLSEAVTADRVIVLDAGEVAFSGGLSGLLELGDRLDDWGLEIPPLVRLTSRLASLGVPAPPLPQDPGEVAKAVWR